MNLKYFSLIFSITGIVILYLISTLTNAPFVDLNEISKYEGKQVITRGIVTKHYVTNYGSQIITIKNENSSATIFLEEEIFVEYGDRIQVKGEVQKYKGCWEIIANNKQSVVVIEKWQNISILLWQIAQNTYYYEGLNINITGYIDSIYDNYFYLVDEEGEHTLLVFYDVYKKNQLLFGQKVNINGFFVFDEQNFRHVLTFTSDKHKIIPVEGD